VVTTVDPWDSKTRTTVKESWPYVFVYCFPHNVTFRKEVTECPPFVFRIDASEAFELSNSYHYAPSAVEFNAGVELVTMDVL
jgi:hypothetical protein